MLITCLNAINKPMELSRMFMLNVQKLTITTITLIAVSNEPATM